MIITMPLLSTVTVTLIECFLSLRHRTKGCNLPKATHLTSRGAEESRQLCQGDAALGWLLYVAGTVILDKAQVSRQGCQVTDGGS